MGLKGEERSAMAYLQQIWRWLTEPSGTVKDIAARRRAWLLNVALVIAILASGLSLLYRLIVVSGRKGPVTGIWIAIVLLSLLYILARSRYASVAAGLATLAIPAVIFSNLYFEILPGGGVPAALMALVLGLFVSLILMPAWGTLVVGILNLVGILLLPWMKPDLVPDLAAVGWPLLWNTVAAVLALAAGYHRNQIEFERCLSLSLAANELNLQQDHRQRAERLLQALNIASLAIQKAQSADDIFTAVGNTLKQLDFSCTIFLVDGQYLRPVYFSYAREAIQSAETLLGVQAENFRIHIDSVDVMRQVIRARETVYTADAFASTRQLLPGPLKPFTRQVIDLLKVPRTVNAPLILESDPFGIFCVQSDELQASDAPAITAFANQMASAWSKADLLAQLEQGLQEQIRAEDELRKSEAKYRGLFENAPEGIILLSMTGMVLDTNQAALTMCGLSRPDVIGKSFMDLGLLDQEQLPNYLDAFSKAISGERIEPLVISLQHLDGRQLWLEVFSTQLTQKSEPLGLQLMTRDITVQRQATEALRLSEERFRSIFENAVMGVYRTSLDGRILLANPALVRMLGYERFEELENIDLNAEEFYLDRPRQVFIDQICAEGDVMGFESTWKRKDGSLVHVQENARAILDQDGEPEYFEGTVEDITRRKEIERQRQNLIELQRLVVSLSTRFINLETYEIDAAIVQAMGTVARFVEVDSCNIWFFSPDRKTASKRYGWRADGRPVDIEHTQDIQLDALPWYAKKLLASESIQVSDVEDLPAEAGALKRLMQNLEIMSLLTVPLEREGNVVGDFTMVMNTSRRTWSEETIALMRIVGDIILNALERKRSVENIRKLNEQLEQRVIERTRQLEATNKELEAFAYSVSHDLRAPLRSIDGFSAALLEDYGDQFDAEGQDYLQRVRAASQRMSQLIDDLLQLSRLTRIQMDKMPFDISQLVLTISQELRESDPQRQVEFVIQPGLEAYGDVRLLRIMLFNLLANAWKFTGKQPEAVIQFGKTEDQPACFYVRDNGAGFDMAYADKLFATFQRLHTADEFEGTGIGLATVQRIVHRHGGRVWAEGQVGQGAVFYFTLDEDPA
ncbi:MAG: PAS domain S-box protein [Anaerolineales bacterium]|nr:PAS domain S-box protein [Anaerolineales bacterium]